jgi:hypothetical protein
LRRQDGCRRAAVPCPGHDAKLQLLPVEEGSNPFRAHRSRQNADGRNRAAPGRDRTEWMRAID